MIAPASIEQLLNAAVIEEVVGDYVSLKRSGSRYKGVCPFHDEKTPSFTVTPSLGIYKCFGCQKGGNSINFLMEIEKLTYQEAIRQLATRYNITLIETGKEHAEEYAEQQKLRDNLAVVNEFALSFFQQQLWETEEGKTIGLSYFKERGFTHETIRKWKLGYSPEAWEALAKEAKNQGYNLETMILGGLLKQREKGDVYDLFRNRVMFTIHSVSGKPIAFAGRKMGNADNVPKYVNSPETELYKKSEVLFGLFEAKNAIKKFDKVLLTEGYTDVITLNQNGIENSVASSGTALTQGQIKQLRRFTPNITVIYDGDKAGIKASLRGINLLLAEDMNVRVVPLPEGEDPDSYCKKLGGEEFVNYINKNEVNFIYFKADLLLSETQDDPIKRTEAIRDILDSVANISDPLKRSALVFELSKICKMELKLLEVELQKLVLRNNNETSKALLREAQQIVSQIDEKEAADAILETDTQKKYTEYQELALLELLFKFGDKSLFLAANSEDEGQENLEMKLSDFILNEIKTDENLFFENELVNLIFSEIMNTEFVQWPEPQYFIHHTNEKIATLAATIFSTEHQLSSYFSENKIYVKTEVDNYAESCLQIFNYLRLRKLDSMLSVLIKNMQNAEQESDIDYLLSAVQSYTQHRKKLSEIMGMVVHRMN